MGWIATFALSTMLRNERCIILNVHVLSNVLASTIFQVGSH